MKPKRRCAKMSTSCFHQALSAPKKEKKKMNPQLEGKQASMTSALYKKQNYFIS